MSISAYCIPPLSPVVADFSTVAALESLLQVGDGSDDCLNAKRAAAGVWLVSDLYPMIRVCRLDQLLPLMNGRTA